MRFITLLLIVFGIFVLVTPSQHIFAQGQNPQIGTVKLFGLDLGCYAHLPPDDSQGNGCGLHDFIRLLKQIINYLTVIIVPLAAAMVVWGGLVIMIAAGSMEKISKGRQIITTAVIGILIAFGSWLIVNTIYLALTGFGV